MQDVKREGPMSYDLTHARHDPAHCLAPGLFRSFKKGDRKKIPLNVTYKFGKNEQLEFSCSELLGADDLKVLQGLVAMAGPNGVILHEEAKTEVGQQLRLLLETKWEAVQKDSQVVKGSYYTLAKEIGYEGDGGKVFKLLRDSIERLWKVSIIAQKPSASGKVRRQGYRLLADYASDEADGKLYVALNPRITEAILGRRAFTRIDMYEVRSLKSDCATLIHQRLCGWIDVGITRAVTMETLIGYVWPNSDGEYVQAEPSTERNYRQRIKQALGELRSVGWDIDEYVKGKFNISRPSQKNSEI